MICPHPGRIPSKWFFSRSLLLVYTSHMLYIIIDYLGIRPVAFNGDDGEAFVFDKLPGDACAHVIELGRTM